MNRGIQLFSIIILFVSSISAQELERSVVATAGNVDENSVVSMEWTLGEIMVESIQDGQILLTQGFHQPRLSVTGIADNEQWKNKSIALFPNPSHDLLYIQIKDNRRLRSVKLYDVPGNLLLEKYFQGEFHTGSISMDRYADGTYLLKLEFAENGEFSIHKVVKN